jgi:phenylacetic acid degradation protein
MPVYSFEGLTPVVHPTAFLHPTAVLIGDVIVGEGVYIGPGASLRGDFGRIEVMKGANVQDNCVMHSFPGAGAIIEEDGHIGHGAIVHGARVGRNVLVGMNAVLMDNVLVGENAIVGAMAFVKAEMQIPPNVLVAGAPARIIRDLKDSEIAWKKTGTQEYKDLAVRCRQTLRECAPLTQIETDRPRLPGDFKPIHQARRE